MLGNRKAAYQGAPADLSVPHASCASWLRENNFGARASRVCGLSPCQARGCAIRGREIRRMQMRIGVPSETKTLEGRVALVPAAAGELRSEEHTSELQSLMRNSYDVFCLKK